MNLFDTNVVTAAILTHREHHEVANLVFSHHRTNLTAAISTHSLAEIYNVLTGRARIPTSDALRLMKLNLQNVKLVSLEPNEYQKALQRVSSSGLSGGVIFDALIAECALKIGAEALFTFNLRHFTRLGTDIAQIAREPEDTDRI